MKKGFTLIEVLVSVSIFAIVMLVATGSVFSIVEANKKTHSLKSVMTNLNFALESITRNIRVGTAYKCMTSAGAITVDPVAGDCTHGDVGFHLTSNLANGQNAGTFPLEYTFQKDSNNIGRIYRQFIGKDASPVPITAAEINITNMMFYAVGTQSSDSKQPKVTIIIQGYAGVGNTKSSFNIETTVSQRAIDS
jgi:prepilin-type N-terminal cleavage/methylation domain-containing protein